MKLDMLADVPDVGVRPQSQKMAELRNGSWMLALEKEQLSRHVAYSPMHGYRDSSMRQDWQPQSDSKENVQARTFPTPVPATEQSHQLPDTRRAEMFVNGDQTAVSIFPKATAERVATSSQSSFVSGRVPDVKAHATKSDATPLSAEPAMKDEVGQDHSSHQMHLYEKDGMVQVWIRDANLPGVSLAPMVNSIRLELKESGRELAELTVNGKRVDGISPQAQSCHGDRVILQSNSGRE